MTTIPPLLPAAPNTVRTVIGARSLGDHLSFQEYHFVLLNTAEAGKSFSLGGMELSIGKSSESDIVLDHPTVSRSHLRLLREGDRFLAQDLGSTNGTFVDGAQIREAFLKPGAVVEVGDVQLRFEAKVAPVEIAPLEETHLGDLAGQSVAMRQIFALLKRIATLESTVLLTGETGAGKGAAAKAIHRLSPRSEGPFVVFDCASVAEALIESELFGHERGAFTGAVSQRIGCLERANGGTLFLDEVDDLGLSLQPKLLRAIEEREVLRLGGSTRQAFDARIIVASKKDLWSEAQAGRFREDLYFRLSVFTVPLPPLRNRKEDLPLLVDAFATEGFWNTLPPATRDQFTSHSWPGNVRELRNAVERARHIGGLSGIMGEDLLRSGAQGPQGHTKVLPVRYDGPFKVCKEEVVQSFEREYLSQLLLRCEGNIAKAAREAEVDRKHLYSLLNKYGLASNDT